MFRLPNVPTSDDLIDKAFHQGSKVAKATRSSRKPREKRMRVSEHRRVTVIGGVIESDLLSIVKNFPSYEELPNFHKRLLEIKIDKDVYKQSLGAVHWCLKNVQQLKRETLRDLKGRNDTRPAQDFLGRVASMVKKIRKDLDELIEIKAVLREFPDLEDVPTLVVSGYPNVGKSTFMKSLTGSDVQIAPYPFTTQSILIGHTMRRHQRYQVIDSPGL
jgi:nucleolar GTP-binding protein